MSAKSRPLVQCLRVFWIIITLWYELLVFYSSVRHCSWPDSALSPGQLHAHILLVADPQILDHHSYPDRSPTLTYLTRLIVDLNIRKSWRAALRTYPDAVIFLGDMMDGGRSTITDVEYEQYYRRFEDIFSTPSQIPVHFIPGNHDIGLQISTSISAPARARYRAHFGNLNSRLSITNHTIVLLDALSLVEEDNKRAERNQSYNEWHPFTGGSVEFVRDVAREYRKDPVILFSHIPLYRSGGDCGPLREKGTIHPGGGFGYQNTLGKEATTFLLQTLQPSIVFSGDDHDYCVYYHPTTIHGGPSPIREVSLKSISMAMGIRHPGFQLLSLDPWDGLGDRPQQTHADAPCRLPDQLGIYLSVYIPLLLVSIFFVSVGNAHRMRRPMSSPFTRQPTRRMSSSLHPANTNGFEPHHHMEDAETAEDKIKHASLVLPHPVSASLGRRGYLDLIVPCRQIGARTCKLFPDNILSRSEEQQGSRRQKRLSFLGGSLLNIRDIAIFPLTVFVLISLYVIYN